MKVIYSDHYGSGRVELNREEMEAFLSQMKGNATAPMVVPFWGLEQEYRDDCESCDRVKASNE